jgi:hypothetical protein
VCCRGCGVVLAVWRGRALRVAFREADSARLRFVSRGTGAGRCGRGHSRVPQAAVMWEAHGCVRGWCRAVIRADAPAAGASLCTELARREPPPPPPRPPGAGVRLLPFGRRPWESAGTHDPPAPIFVASVVPRDGDKNRHLRRPIAETGSQTWNCFEICRDSQILGLKQPQLAGDCGGPELAAVAGR